MEIDVCIVSGRRPDLLGRTLNYFESKLFRNFTIKQCFINIDPFTGCEPDGDHCKEIVSRYFCNPIFFEPQIASFGMAVKKLWQHGESPFLFHLEDDWIISESVFPEQIEPLFVDKTRSVRLAAKEMNWNGKSQFRESFVRKRTDKGYLLTTRSSFTLGPSFFRSDFTKRCSEMMNPELDPEKQLLKGGSRELSDFTKDYQSRIYSGAEQTYIVEDIGREWRRLRGITKTVQNSQSTWATEIKNVPLKISLN